MKIIGCGTRDRGDDQAGLAVADRLRELGFEAEAYTGDPLALLDRWSAADDVILIDAVQTGAAPGTLHIWDGDLPKCSTSAVSSHGFDIAKALEVARILNRLPARLRILGIEGLHFSQTANLSPEVADAVQRTAQEIANLARSSSQ
jgi:hydrogenase maturation protease